MEQMFVSSMAVKCLDFENKANFQFNWQPNDVESAFVLTLITMIFFKGDYY